MNSSVLLVARAFPPFAASLGGAIRMLKLAEYLRDEGLKVIVLAGAGREYGDFGYGQLLRSISVHYVRDPILARTGPAAHKSQSSSQRVSRSFLRPIVSECSVPDTGIFALPALWRSARDLIERLEIRNLVTSGPPHSDHLVGLLAKKRYGDRLNWIADYRDSWNGTELFRKRFWPFQSINRLLERAVLRRADHLTYVSPPMVDKMAALMRADGGAVGDKARLVLNGYDANMGTSRITWVNDGGPLRIGYFGMLDDRRDSYRNPTSLFETIIRHRLNVRLEFFGQIRLSDKWRQELGDKISLNGVLSHAEAVRRMQDCDVLMLLHTKPEGADEVITGKFFEYLLTGRPIVSIGPENMAVNRLLAEMGIGRSVPHDDDQQLVATLVELIELKVKGALTSAPAANVERFSRAQQYRTIMTLLHAS